MRSRDQIRNSKTISEYDYTLQKRNQLRNGEWGPWEERGGGDWLGAPQLFNQLKMLKKSNPSRAVEIRFHIKGIGLCDSNGNYTGKTIILK